MSKNLGLRPGGFDWFRKGLAIDAFPKLVSIHPTARQAQGLHTSVAHFLQSTLQFRSEI